MKTASYRLSSTLQRSGHVDCISFSIDTDHVMILLPTRWYVNNTDTMKKLSRHVERIHKYKHNQSGWMLYSGFLQGLCTILQINFSSDQINPSPLPFSSLSLPLRQITCSTRPRWWSPSSPESSKRRRHFSSEGTADSIGPPAGVLRRSFPAEHCWRNHWPVSKTGEAV